MYVCVCVCVRAGRACRLEKTAVVLRAYVRVRRRATASSGGCCTAITYTRWQTRPQTHTHECTHGDSRNERKTLAALDAHLCATEAVAIWCRATTCQPPPPSPYVCAVHRAQSTQCPHVRTQASCEERHPQNRPTHGGRWQRTCLAHENSAASIAHTHAHVERDRTL